MTRTFATQPPESDAADVSKLYLDVSCPRNAGVGDGSSFAADRITFRRWRLGFFIVYGALAIFLVAGSALIGDRRPASFSAAALTKPAIVTTGSIPKPVEGRMLQ